MIDLNDYDNEGKKEVFYNEEEEIISKKEDSISNGSKGIIDEAEEEENINAEGSEDSEGENPAKELEGYMIQGNEDIGDLLAQDEDDNNVKIDKINELLFCCQGIGKYILNENKKLIYVKNEYCIPSLKDIHRFLRNDSKETQIFKRAFLNWKIVETDLIPCLITNEDDEKICQTILIIFVDLTEELEDNVDGRKELEFSIAKLNETLIKGEVIDLISRKLNTGTEEYTRAKCLKENYKKLELEENKRKKEKEKEKEKEKKEQEKSNNEDKNNTENKIEEEKSESNKDNNNEEKESKSNNEVDKKLDTSMERKKILLRQIAQMEYKSKNLIELLFILLKQIMSIANTSDLNDTSKICSLLFIKFTELKLFDAILYYVSTFNDLENYPFTKEILAPHLLCILYYITRLFEPKILIKLSSRIITNKHGTINENDGKELTRLAELEKQEFLQRKMLFASRGNTYNYRVQINRPIDNSSYFVNNMNQIINKNTANYVKEKTNTFKNQRHGPRYRRGHNIFKDKKIPKSIIISEIKMINDTKIKTYFSEKSSEITSDNFNPTIIELKKFFVQLMENNSFNGLIDFYYFKFDKEYELEKYDLYYLINIMTFFIEFSRLLNHKEIKDINNNNNKTNFNFKRIGISLSKNMITFMYNTLYTEILKEDKEERKGFLLFPLLGYLKQAVYALMDSYRFSKNNLSEEHDSFNLTINVMIQDSLLTKDYSKIIVKLFEIYNELYYPVDYLYDIIEFSEIYYTALEHFTQKRELKIKTTKKLKKKKKVKSSVDEEKEILKHLDKIEKKYETEDLDENLKPIQKVDLNEKDENDKDEDDNESNTYGENDFSDEDSEDDRIREISRDINVNDESKCLVNYNIIDKIFSIFKNVSGTLVDNFDLSKKLIELKNSQRGILKYIVKLIERIAVKSKCFWIFFNIQYLVLFNRLLNDQCFKNEPAYKLFKTVIEKILDEYFTIIKKNKMLPIECLFHLEGLTLIEAIMNNYEYPEDKIQYENENKHYYGGINKKNQLEGFISDDENKDSGNENEKKENNDNDSGEEYYQPGITELFTSKKKKEEKEEKKKKKLKKKAENDENEENDDENIKNEEEEEKNKIKWTKEMDKILIDYYFDKINEDRTNIKEIIDDLINVELKDFKLDFKIHDIKHRLHKLKVKKGKKKAMKRYNKIHHIEMDIDTENSKDNEKDKNKNKTKEENKKYNSDLVSNYIYKLSDKSKEIEFKINLNNCLDSIKDQLTAYKKKMDILGDENNNMKCELIPTTTAEMILLKDEDLKNLLFTAGFYYNNDTDKITLRSNKINEIDLINESIDIYKNIIDENVEQDRSNENERKEQKEKYTEMQKKKHNNSKKLKDYIMTEEQMKNEREKQMQDLEDDNSSRIIFEKKNKNKKKKKLIKKTNNDLNSIEEEDDKNIKSLENTKNKNVINDEDIEIKGNNI